MVWKPKEKELTQEEAVALARKELAPFWFNSPPLLAAVRNGGKISVHPIDPSYDRHPWLIFFIDPTEFSGDTALIFAREFHRRYSPHGLGIILVCKPEYAFLRESSAVEQYIRQRQINFPLALDSNGLLAGALRAAKFPKVLMVNGSEIVFEHEGQSWMNSGSELAIQHFFRRKDAGLALLSLYETEKPIYQDVGGMEFGRGRKASHPVNEKPGLKGKWEQDDDKITTSDAEAEITFRCPSSELSIIARSSAKTSESSKISIEINGNVAPDLFGGDDLIFDEEGHSVIRIEYPKIYWALKELPSDQREITLRFPFSNRVPVSLYGLRFGQVAK